MLDALLAEVRSEGSNQLLACALPTRVGADVDEADVAHSEPELAFRDPGYAAVGLGDDDAAFAEIRLG